MKSIKIDLLREGGAAGILEPGKRYHLAIDSAEHRQKEMTMIHDEFLERLVYLRYTKGISDAQKKQAIDELSNFSNYFFDLDGLIKDNKSVQIDLVTNALELMAIPFEVALNKDGESWFATKDHPVVLTRRLPIGFIDKQLQWPARPRILFAYANPKGINLDPVPSNEHKSVLLDVLRSWMLPLKDFDGMILDEKTVLTTLPQASLHDIGKACDEAARDGKPYTYIHILAHGKRVVDPLFMHRINYGVILSSDDDTPVMANELVGAIKQDKLHIESPLVVTLCICDAANSTNTIVETRNIAQELHAKGVPIVIGSQLPFTFKGSEILTETFYKSILFGDDARLALHKARVALKMDSEAGLDWIGVVGYMRLPEGYGDYLMKARLAGKLAAMETISKWAGKIINDDEINDLQYNQVEKAFTGIIDQLDAFIKEIKPEDKKSLQAELSENSGLLGSSYKRTAELQWYRSKEDDTYIQKSKSFLLKSRDAYQQGFFNDPSSHWNALNYISLDAIVAGTINDIAAWYACYVTAKNEFENKQIRMEDRVWALGSLVELHLLSALEPTLTATQIQESGKYISDFNDLIRDNVDKFDVLSPVTSLRRQISRYVHWWVKDNGYFANVDHDLKEDAKALLRLLTV